MSTETTTQPFRHPIINCHTHIFTGDHVPPYLAKTFLPWPFYYLLPISLVVKLFRFWYNTVYTWQFKPWYNQLKEIFYKVKMFAARYGLLRFFSFLIGIFLVIQVFFILFSWLSYFSSPSTSVNNSFENLRSWMWSHGLIFIPASVRGKLLLVLLLMLFYKSGRNLVWVALKKIWSFLGILSGPDTKDLARRYLNIGRFAFYKQQTRVFGRLKNQYPAGTGFVILPMDMEYMSAGTLKKESIYSKQMQALAALKSRLDKEHVIYPFIFADPRRIIAEGPLQFDYRVDNGTVILHDCFIKKYIEEMEFSGFKIYPALGYYPFDEALLPLWKYAADNGFPITTHCIRGTIYYRGRKKKEWDIHPVFNQAKGNDKYEPLKMLEVENKDFANNFTHPLNYLCLLEESLLRKLVANAKDDKIRELFGFTNLQTPLLQNLGHLKICFGHFGGDDEWNRFIELDRDNFGNQLVRHPEKGITFLTDEEGNHKLGKPEQLWKYADWYSIICSLMLQYSNVYADVSYILHKPEVQPLLKQTLLNPKLRTKVLFGTDFYVVRNHKSEKNMLADMLFYLKEPEFDQIARINPIGFLSNNRKTVTAI